jgi:hypothetical protein
MTNLAPYKLSIAEKAIESKGSGVTFRHFAKSNGIPYSTLIGWLDQIKKEKGAKPDSSLPVNSSSPEGSDDSAVISITRDQKSSPDRQLEEK